MPTAVIYHSHMNQVNGCQWDVLGSANTLLSTLFGHFPDDLLPMPLWDSLITTIQHSEPIDNFSIRVPLSSAYQSQPYSAWHPWNFNIRIIENFEITLTPREVISKDRKDQVELSLSALLLYESQCSLDSSYLYVYIYTYIDRTITLQSNPNPSLYSCLSAVRILLGWNYS